MESNVIMPDKTYANIKFKNRSRFSMNVVDVT